MSYEGTECVLEYTIIFTRGSMKGTSVKSKMRFYGDCGARPEQRARWWVKNINGETNAGASKGFLDFEITEFEIF